MANDIAVLGIQVDSKAVDQGSASLDKLAASSKGAEASVRSFEQGATKATNATTQFANQISRTVNSAANINQRLGVATDFGTAQRSADIAAYGASLDELRAKINPLFAVEMKRKAQLAEIDHALATGAINQVEYASAVNRVAVTSRMQTHAIQTNERAILSAGKGALIAGHQMTNLAFQINDVATMAALGADPLRILATQGGQFFQILAQTEGGVRAGLRGVFDMVTSLITPTRLLVGALGGVAGAGIAAAASWASAQRDIQLALLGVGGMTGLTADGINRITIAAAEAGQATVGQAREVALALASTGRIGEDVLVRAIALSRNFQRVFGVDNAEAAAMLAKALADPAKGVDDMNRRLSAFDDATTQHIKNLTAQNRGYEAQRLLLDGVNRSTVAASAATSGWSAAWTKLSETASQFWAAFGASTARSVGLGTLTQQLADANRELQRLKSRQSQMDPEGRRLGLTNQIDEQIRRIRQLQQAIIEINQAAAEAAANARARDLGDLVRSIVPDTTSLQGLVNDWAKLQDLARQPGVLERVDPAVAANLQRSIELRRTQIAGFRTAIQLAQEEFEFEARRIAARTPALQAQITLEETLSRARRSGIATEAEAQQQAANAASLVLRRAAEDLKRTQEQRVLSAQQSVQTAQMELSLAGRTTHQQELQRALQQNLHQAEQESLRMYGKRDAFDRSHLAALDAESVRQAEINNRLRQRQMAQEVQFERDQLGRTQQEQEVFSRLRSAGMLTNGEIQGAAAEAMAAQVRLNVILRNNIDASREFASSFVRDMMAGKNATEALASALNRLADRLVDIAMDNAFQSLFGGKGGANSLLTGLFGGNTGSAAAPAASGGGWNAVVVPQFHKGGLVGAGDNQMRVANPTWFRGARRYHQGSMGVGLAGDEVPAILRRGEVVLPKGTNAGGGMVIHMPVTIDARGAYPESISEIRASVAGLERSLPSRIVETVREARDRNAA